MKKSLIAAAFALTLPALANASENGAGETLCVEFEKNTYFCTDVTRRQYDRTSDGRRSLSTSGFIILDDGSRLDDCKLHTLRNRQVMRDGAECRAPE